MPNQLTNSRVTSHPTQKMVWPTLSLFLLAWMALGLPLLWKKGLHSTAVPRINGELIIRSAPARLKVKLEARRFCWKTTKETLFRFETFARSSASWAAFPTCWSCGAPLFVSVQRCSQRTPGHFQEFMLDNRCGRASHLLWQCACKHNGNRGEYASPCEATQLRCSFLVVNRHPCVRQLRLISQELASEFARFSFLVMQTPWLTRCRGWLNRLLVSFSVIFTSNNTVRTLRITARSRFLSCRPKGENCGHESRSGSDCTWHESKSRLKRPDLGTGVSVPPGQGGIQIPGAISLSH